MVNIRLLVIGYITLTTLGVSHAANITEGCRLAKSHKNVAYVGWPTSMSCRSLISAYMRHFRRSGMKPTGNATCIIVDTEANTTLWSKNIDAADGFLFHNSKFITDDMTLNSTTKYLVILKGVNSTCFYDEITLNITHQPEETCSKTQNTLGAIETSGRPHSPKSMSCEVPYEVEPKIDLDDSRHTYTVTWFRNCTEIKSNNSLTGYRITGRELVVTSLDFDKAGLYSCSITYKGRTRFPIWFSLCIKPQRYDSNPEMDCPETISTKVGESAKVTCNVNVGFNSATGFAVNAKWQKMEKDSRFSCSNFIGRGTSDTLEGRAICYTNTSKAQEHNEKCYLYEPSEEEKEPIKNILKMTLEIRDMKSTDFGKYNVEYGSYFRKVNDTVHLIRQEIIPQKFYIYIIIALVAVVGIILIVIAAMFIRKRAKKSLSKVNLERFGG